MDNKEQALSGRLLALFTRIRGKIARINACFYHLTARDLYCVVIIIVLASVLRLPHIAFPAVTQFDELIYADNALYLVQGIPFVDTHPPLVRMMFAEVTRFHSPFTTTRIPLGDNIPFGDFPFTAVRTFVALFGIFLPIVIYMLGRAMKLTPRMALLPALLVALDSALTAYSRAILPDTILLCFNFLLLASAFMLVNANTTRRKICLIIATGILAGLALSIKWTALGVLACVWLLFILKKQLRALFVVTGIAFLTYVLVFAMYLLCYFPNGGAAKNVGIELAPNYVGNIQFPPFTSLTQAIAFLPSYHKVMWQTNNDPYVLATLQKAQGPLYWPISHPEIYFWMQPESERSSVNVPRVDVVGNFVIWVACFLAWFFNLCWIVRRWIQKRALPIDTAEVIIMCGYVMNYLPFLLIHRQMFLYHYFTALIFLFLLTPYALPRIRLAVERITHDRVFSYVLMMFICMLALLNFAYNIPLIYGTHSLAYYFTQSR